MTVARTLRPAAKIQGDFLPETRHLQPLPDTAQRFFKSPPDIAGLPSAVAWPQQTAEGVLSTVKDAKRTNASANGAMLSVFRWRGEKSNYWVNLNCKSMKPNTIANNTKLSVFLWLYMAIFYLCLTRSAYSDNATNTSVDLVAFFKQAIGSPPEIERYVAKRTNLPLPINQTNGSPAYQYFEGALSGTNFFLHHLPDPDRPTDTNHLDIISARAGSSAYEIGGHGLIKGMGQNGLTDDVKAQYSLSRQILGMGADEIEPDTVKWDGNNFTATNVVGKGVHGSLQVSNNLPVRMEVSLDNRPLPYEAIEYTYTTPADSFAGYPAGFLIYYKSKDGLKPMAEVEFKSLLLATQHLDASIFSEARFADLYRYTNVYSNSDFYASKTKSKQLIKVNSYVESGGLTNSNSRKVIYLCFLFVTLFPVTILVIWSVRKTKNTKQTK